VIPGAGPAADPRVDADWVLGGLLCQGPLQVQTYETKLCLELKCDMQLYNMLASLKQREGLMKRIFRKYVNDKGNSITLSTSS
jgi:hypothetical protein